MPDFKVGRWAKRVRNSTRLSEQKLGIKPGQEFLIEEVQPRDFLSDGTNFVRARDCELVEPSGSDQQLPERITVPEHTLPWHLTEEPEEGARVWAVSTNRGCLEIAYCPAHDRHLFLAGLLYTTEADAQERYDRITAPTRREE